MTVTTDAGPQRWGVFNRRDRRRPWVLVVSHGDRRAAERLLIDLAATAKQSGDWKVGPVTDPAASTPTPGHRGR